jgi:phage-related protein
MVQSEREGKRLLVVFYRSRSGDESVRDWLKGLERNDRRRIGIDIKTVEFGWPIGMPTCRSLGGGLWEVRSHLSNGRVARVMFCIHSERMVLLHVARKRRSRLEGR